MERTSSTKDREDIDEDDIAQCPVLKDKLDSLTPEQKREMRKKYEELVKPTLKKLGAKQTEEDKKEKKAAPEEKKSKTRKQHPRMAELRNSQGSCPFMNSSNPEGQFSRADRAQ